MEGASTSVSGSTPLGSPIEDLEYYLREFDLVYRLRKFDSEYCLPEFDLDYCLREYICLQEYMAQGTSDDNLIIYNEKLKFYFRQRGIPYGGFVFKAYMSCLKEYMKEANGQKDINEDSIRNIKVPRFFWGADLVQSVDVNLPFYVPRGVYDLAVLEELAAEGYQLIQTCRYHIRYASDRRGERYLTPVIRNIFVSCKTSVFVGRICFRVDIGDRVIVLKHRIWKDIGFLMHNQTLFSSIKVVLEDNFRIAAYLNNNGDTLELFVNHLDPLYVGLLDRHQSGEIKLPVTLKKLKRFGINIPRIYSGPDFVQSIEADMPFFAHRDDLSVAVPEEIVPQSNLLHEDYNNSDLVGVHPYDGNDIENVAIQHNQEENVEQFIENQGNNNENGASDHNEEENIEPRMGYLFVDGNNNLYSGHLNYHINFNGTVSSLKRRIRDHFGFLVENQTLISSQNLLMDDNMRIRSYVENFGEHVELLVDESDPAFQRWWNRHLSGEFGVPIPFSILRYI